MQVIEIKVAIGEKWFDYDIKSFQCFISWFNNIFVLYFLKVELNLARFFCSKLTDGSPLSSSNQSDLNAPDISVDWYPIQGVFLPHIQCSEDRHQIPHGTD